MDPRSDYDGSRIVFNHERILRYVLEQFVTCGADASFITRIRPPRS